MKKNILTENMRRFGTKNLHEQSQSQSNDKIYDAILNLLVEMSDTDIQTVERAVEGANVDKPGIQHYEMITKDIIPMLHRIAKDIDENRYHYYPENI